MSNPPEGTGALGPDLVVFDRYRLVRLLGRGGFGTVWLAIDENLHIDVAIKFLSSEIVDNPEAIEDLKHETRYSLRLTHPNIVRIHGFLQARERAGIVMEYVDGGTLSALKMQKPTRCFSVAELAPYVVSLCDALDYAHGKVKVVHRDLKPGNLMVDSAGDLKVADFGISRSISDTQTRLTAAKPVTGTLAYMSPQQLMGDPPRLSDDVYSLGATLFDLLAGKPPFYTGDITEQVRSKLPPKLSERRQELAIEHDPIPEPWERTIALCLAKDPSGRPQSAGRVAELLGLVAASGPIEVEHPTMIVDPEATMRRPGPVDRPREAAAEAGNAGDSPATATGRGQRDEARTSGRIPAGAAPGEEGPPSRGADRTGRAETPPESTQRRTETARGRAETGSGAPDGARRLPVPLIAGAVLLVAVGFGAYVAFSRGGGDEKKPDRDAAGESSRENDSPDVSGDDAVKPDQGSPAEPATEPPPTTDRTTRTGADSTTVAGRDDRNPPATAPDARRIESLRASVRNLIKRKEWDRAETSLTELLAAAPSDDQTDGWRREIKAGREVAGLRAKIRTAIEGNDRQAARARVARLLELAPGDAEALAWQRELAVVAEPPPERMPDPPPPAPTTTTTTPPKGPTAEQSVRAVIDQYRMALETLDVERYAALWVSLSGDRRRAIEQSFRDTATQKLEIANEEIAVSGNTATARFREKRTVTPKAGKSEQRELAVLMKLAKSDDGRWRIESLEYKAP